MTANKQQEPLKPFSPPKDGSFELEDVYYISIKGGVPKKVFLKDVIDITKHTWKKGKTPIINLPGVQMIADYENIVEKKFETSVVPTGDNHQQHVVNIWVGNDGIIDNWTRASGEASKLNTGDNEEKGGKLLLKEGTKIDSQYKYNMADKRAFCRAVLRHIRLFGVYSSVEAQSFKNTNINDYDY